MLFGDLFLCWIEYLFGMSRGILLCHYWPNSCYGHMRQRSIFGCICDCVLVMPCWRLFFILSVVDVFQLLGGALSGLNRFQRLFCMPLGFLLRHHRSIGCDRNLCRGNICCLHCNCLPSVSLWLLFFFAWCVYL